MKRAVFSLLTLALFCLPAHADRLDEWYKLLPKNTVGVIAIKNTSELLADWDKSGFSKMMADEEFLRWTAPSRKDGDAPWDKFTKEISGQGFYDTLKNYPGASIAVITGDSPDDFTEKGMLVGSLSEVGDKQKELEEMKARENELQRKENPDLKERTEDIGGVTVHVIAEEGADAEWEDAWAIVEGVFIEVTARPLMEHFIAALKSGTAETSDVVSGHLARLAQLTEGNTDVLLYLNGVTLTKWLSEGLAEQAKDAKAAMPVDPTMILAALGVDELQALGFTLDLADDQSRFEFGLLHPDKPTGIVSLMRGTSTDVSLPNFIPADVLGGSVTRYSIGDLYDKLLVMIGKLGPLAMMATMQIGQVEAAAGVKLKGDLFGSLADEYVEIADGTALEQSQVLAFKIKDRPRLGGAMDGVKRFVGAGFGAFEESEYLGWKINTLKMAKMNAQASGAAAPNTPEIAYCVTEDYLFFSTGKQALLKKVLARMKDPSGPGIWDAPRTQALMARMPKGYMGIGVADGSKQMKLIIDTVTAVQSQVGNATKKSSTAKKKGPGKGPKADAEDSATKTSDSWFDPKAAPSEEMFKRHFGNSVSGYYNPPDALHIRVLGASPEAQ